MSTEKKDERRATRHGFWFGIVIGGLAGALLVGTVGPVLASRALSHRFGGAGMQDPAAVQERAEFAAGFILERVDATQAQQAEVKRIVSDTIGAVMPLAQEHRANREAFHTEFARVDIDAEAIERLRQSEMALADQASRELTEAFTGFAQTLTLEQRNELMEMAQRFHR